MLNSSVNLNIGWMNTLRHNALRTRGVQERSDWSFIIPRTDYFVGIGNNSMGGLLYRSPTIVGLNFLPVPYEGSDGLSLTRPVSEYPVDISLHTLRIRCKLMPSARGKGMRYRP
jgi:hypothetical protein